VAPRTFSFEIRSAPRTSNSANHRLTACGYRPLGRTVAELVLPDGRFLNHEIVRAGYVWWDRRHAPGDVALLCLERQAREDKRGFWAQPRPGLTPFLAEAKQ